MFFKFLKKIIYPSNVMSESGGSHLGMNISQTKTQTQLTGWCLAAQNGEAAMICN